MPQFLPTSGFRGIDPKKFPLNKNTGSSSKGSALEADLDYQKKIWELNNYYLLAWDKIKIKREILFMYQLKVADLYNIPIGNIKSLLPNFLDKEKYVHHFENLHLYLRLGLTLKKYII